jgi:hypothetical protein
MKESASCALRAAKEACGKSYRQIAKELGKPESYKLVYKIIEKDEYASLGMITKFAKR